MLRKLPFIELRPHPIPGTSTLSQARSQLPSELWNMVLNDMKKKKGRISRECKFTIFLSIL